jgi:hypothetical protein
MILFEGTFIERDTNMNESPDEYIGSAVYFKMSTILGTGAMPTAIQKSVLETTGSSMATRVNIVMLLFDVQLM